MTAYLTSRAAALGAALAALAACVARGAAVFPLQPASARARLLAPLAAASLLAACATTSVPLSSSPVAAYRDRIDMAGRISVQYEHDGQPESLSGKFAWTQVPGQIDVALASPLGQTMAVLTVTPRQATLTQADHAPRTAPDIDQLTAETLGWPLPVAGLRDWLQGYATAADGSRFAASPAHSTVVTRDGWHLRYVSWQDGAGAPQPRRIDAERPATLTASALALRIVLDPAA